MASFAEIVSTVTRLAEIPELEARQCGDILGCRFEKTDNAEYVADSVGGLFASVEVRIGPKSGLVNLGLDPAADLAGYAGEVTQLGEPESMDMVSPPILDPAHPDRRPDWDRKYSILHTLGGRPVWFGFEEAGGRKRLVSISIHYDRRS